jgi:hypothetical protein
VWHNITQSFNRIKKLNEKILTIKEEIVRMKHLTAIVIGFMLILGTALGQYAHAAGLIPVVEKVSSSSHPAIPSGLKTSCKCGPNDLNPCPTCPVIKWIDRTYWAYSYIDNRVGMAIVAYDKDNNLVQRWDKTGARYVWKIDVDKAAQTVTFWGQANQKIVTTWKELFPAPVVKQVPSSSHPAVPSGMKVTCLQGPDVLQSSTTCPVFSWGIYSYWAYSYIDNRNGMGIVAYDDKGNMVYKWDKNGARYVYKITVDNTKQTVTFWGQSNNKIVVAWKELFPPPPLVKAVPSSSHPAIPSGLKVTCMTGPDPKVTSSSISTTCPVIQWCSFTYWAYSYIDNRVGMNLVGYNPAGVIVEQYPKTGARYVYKITVENAAKTITLWGQSSQKIVMTWRELGYPW